MAYNYGTSPVTGLPIPLDDTPLDGTSWAHLAEAISLGVPHVCASQSEQDGYLADLIGAGMGPSSTNLVRVTRTDLAGLTMRHDGTGWHRDWGGDWSIFTYSDAKHTDTANTVSGRGSFAVDLPCAAMLDVDADLFAIPANPASAWGFWIWLRDQTGRDLTPKRYYNNIDLESMTARIRRAVSMPAGPGQVQLWTHVHNNSGAIQWANVAMSGSYA